MNPAMDKSLPMPASLSADASERAPTSADPVVLVIDDQQANVRMVGALLTRSGYRVLPALSGGLLFVRDGNKLVAVKMGK